MTEPPDDKLDNLGRYRLYAELGSGGMGVVYRAYDLTLRRPVALKLLQKSDDPELAYDTLLREARHASALNHPNVCTVFEIGEADGRSFIAMELLDGDPLSRLIPESGLGHSLIAKYGTQIAAAVAHAHTRGIIHRDLKTSNVVIGPDGHAKVLDFGIAVRIADHDSKTLSLTIGQPGPARRILGTLPYMAPELLRGRPADQRTDIWALGVILYEMAIGLRPFKGETGFAVTGAILHEPLPPLPAKVSLGLRDAITRCLRKEPDERYQRADELERDLAATGVDHRPAAVDVEPPSRQSILVLPFVNRSSDRENDYFADGLTDEIITDLSNLQALRVISRTSSMRLRGADPDLPTLARDLKVRYVLKGGVRRVQNTLRITAQLIDAATDATVWGHKYTGDLEDIFSIEDTLAAAIVEALELKLNTQERVQLADHPIQDVPAYDAYLRAKQAMLGFSKESLDRALSYLDQAERLGGPNVLISSARGQVYWQYNNAGVSTDRTYLYKARACGRELLAADVQSPHGHRLLGLIDYQEGHPDTAVVSLKKSLMRNAADVDTLLWLATIYGLAGQPAAAGRLVDQLLEIDPLTPLHQLLPSLLSLMEGKFSRAMQPFVTHHSAALGNPGTRFMHGQVLAMNGQLDDACEVFDGLHRDAPDTFFAKLGRCYRHALDGDRREMEAAVTEDVRGVAETDPQYSWMLSQCYALTGATDEAITWLKRAIGRGFINYPLLSAWDPLLAKIRSEPGFIELMHDVRKQWEAFDA